MIINVQNYFDIDKKEQFAEFAQQKAKGKILTNPKLLNKEERRLYVRDTLREDHRFRIENNPESAKEKFDKLSDSSFKFFRGTSLIFYRDYSGEDNCYPIVFTIGDVHPENFGVMPNENDVPFFSVNDFDEAYFAPFTYDIKRGVTGFYLAAKANGFKKKKRDKITTSFVKGYIEGLEEFAKDDREKWHQYRIDNSPKLIKKLLKKSIKSKRDFLAKSIDLDKECFLISKKVVPLTKEVENFQKVIDEYVKENEIAIKDDNYFKVLDVAVRKGSGTASLGLNRFWILIKGLGDDVEQDVILEMKQARPSALKGLIPEKVEKEIESAQHIVQAHNTHLVGGDRFYGFAYYEDKEYIIRERSRFKNEIDLEDLGFKDFVDYAFICGKTLSQTHARSDEDTGIMEGNAEEKILASFFPQVFIDDMRRFAKQAAKRVEKDFKHFKKDHKMDAFNISTKA
ncbi:MAG: hypothetical protein CMO01_20150 [Thalassobius sp.]|nr:hypothetical protein [Thalassovita sp.]